MDNFKWLHLSDFHTGKDNYGQIKLYGYILEHIKKNKEKGNIPDAVFITGDVANKGLLDEYNMFSNDFLLPLSVLLEDTKIYIVPGNHDLDRTQCIRAAKTLYDVLGEEQTRFFDADSAGLKERNEIFGRFEALQNSDIEDFCFPFKSIFEEKGCYTDIITKEDHKIGIIGINTAWLSNSDNDKEKLTPGKYLLEEAFNDLKDCDYKLVLGHHPLSWFECGQREQIQALLAKNKAMYLHGHMHRNSGELSVALNTGFLSLQSGAAFQAREEERYYNSIQWGELNFEDDTVRITPKKWSVANQEFVPDSSGRLPEAFREEGSDSWRFPYTVEISNKKTGKNEKLQTKVPTGWCLIDQAFIQKRKEPAEEDILKYFDGREPSYNEIFSSFIPAREIVSDIKDEFIRCDADHKIKCVTITGAGGEGKTTVLLQTARMLAEKHGWKALVLRQAEKDTPFPEEQLLNITKEGSWVICVDNCFSVSDKIFELLKKLKAREQHVHFLLCARDVDWNNSSSSVLQWREYSDYSNYRLRGVGKEDADKIINAWGRWGEKGLGRLKGLSTSAAVEKLLLSSKDEEGKNEPEEGALLGAMLTTRYGDDLHNHVRNMLLRLKAVPVGKETLLDAFSYIVAMHSEKLYFLSKTILAQIYNFRMSDVKKYILGPLGDEAASSVSGGIIYTRHISIARSARKILDEEYYVDFDEIFIKLAVAAIEAQKEGEFVDSLKQWKYMSDHFWPENKTLAISLDKKILSIDPSDARVIVHLSKLYRKADQFDLALQLFRDVNYDVKHRPFFAEWALAEANAGNKFASICLSALAMSDRVDERRLDPRNACINLYSIAITFLSLHSMYKNEKYLCAAQAAVKLGEIIDKDDSNIKKLINENPKFKRSNLEEVSTDLKKYLVDGILTAAQEKEICFKDWIPKIESLEYKKLFLLAGIIL